MDLVDAIVNLFSMLLNAVGIVLFAIILGFSIAALIGVTALGVINIKNRLQKR